MNSESWLDTRFAGAGLVAGVGLAWALQLALGSFDRDWILAGFLAAGLGVFVLSVIGKLTARFLGAGGDNESNETAVEEDDEEDDEVAEPTEDAEAPEGVGGPRLRVLLVSAWLEALAVALLAAYFSGNVIIALGAGVIAGVLAVGVSLFLARRLAPEAVEVEEAPAAAPKARKRSRT
jgi:ABC-type antimicrobial peptide transport system permease subunit